MVDKKNLTERDICTKYITPALEAAGWDTQTQFLEEYALTDGRINILKVAPISGFGTPVQIIKDIFGGKDAYDQALKELEEQLYAA